MCEMAITAYEDTMLPRPHSRPTHRRRATVFAGAVWLLALAACADDATAPTTRKTADRPNAIKLPSSTWVTARFVDENNTPAYPMYIHVTPYRGSTWTVADGEGWGDTDPREGFVKRLLPSAPSYTGCLVGTHAIYAYEEGTCHFAVPVNGTADLGVFKVYRRPQVFFQIQDRNGSLIKGGTLTVVAPDSSVQYTLYENYNDDSPTIDGVISFRPGKLGTWSYCEVEPPPGYLLAKPACGTVTVSAWGQNVTVPIKHARALLPPTNPF
jgi:hypothetical protein